MNANSAQSAAAKSATIDSLVAGWMSSSNLAASVIPPPFDASHCPG
jgi:hypothetical protein